MSELNIIQDSTELRKLIAENPDLPIVVMVGEEAAEAWNSRSDNNKHGHWIEKAEEYYRLWQDSGRSWDDMPYFVTGLKFACSHCFKQYDVNAEGVEEWDFCPKCGARMIKDGDEE